MLFTNYRPIAIVSSIGKLLEKIVSEQLSYHLEENDILNNNQYGFRANHSIEHPLLQFSKKLLDSLNDGKINISTFIDLKKAFDTVDLSILLDKLFHYGVRGKELLWFVNYLKRSQQVFTGEALSDIVLMLCGIPQGTVLGPLLFILFINDLPEAVKLFCQLFADDCTLQSEGLNLEELVRNTSYELSKAEAWFASNKLTLNLKKTKFAIYGNSPADLTLIPDLTIGGVPIDRIGVSQDEKSVRFLGLWVSDDSTFNYHIEKIKPKLNIGLYHLSASREFSPMRILLNIYRSLFESQIRFANIIFGSAPRFKIEELFKLQKRAVGHIVKAHYVSHTEHIFLKLNILKIKDLLNHSRACLVHKYRCGFLPKSFTRTFFTYVGDQESSRRGDPLCVIIPELNYKNLSKNPYIEICQAWNNVPYEFKLLTKHSEFKKALQDYHISKYTEVCSKLNCHSCLMTDLKANN